MEKNPTFLPIDPTYAYLTTYQNNHNVMDVPVLLYNTAVFVSQRQR